MIKNTKIKKLICLVLIAVIISTSLGGCLYFSDKVEYYKKQLENEEPEKRLEAIEKLNELEDKEAVFKVMAELLADDANEAVRKAALDAILLVNDESVIAPLYTALNDQSADIRLMAVKKLSDFPSAELVDKLLAILDDENADVAQAADEVLLKVCQSGEALEKIISIFSDPQMAEYIDTAAKIIETNLKAGTVDYDVVLFSAYRDHYSSSRIEKIIEIIESEILTNTDLQSYVIKNFLSDNKSVLYSSEVLFEFMCDNGLEREAYDMLLSLYTLDDYDEHSDYAMKMSNVISSNYKVNDPIINRILDEMETADENVARRMEESLEYLYFYNGIRCSRYFKAVFNDGIEDLSQNKNDFIMSMAYSDIGDTFAPLDWANQGRTEWESMDTDLPLIQSLFECQKYVYDEDYSNKKGPVEFLAILPKDYRTQIMDTAIVEFEKYIKDEPEYSEYLMTTLFEEIIPKEFISAYFATEFASLSRTVKNYDLEDKHQGAIIILNLPYRSTRYSLYNYWDIPTLSRAYSVSQVRYVVTITMSYSITQRPYPQEDILRSDARVNIIDKLTGEVLIDKSFYGMHATPGTTHGDLNYVYGEYTWEDVDEYILEKIEKYTNPEE